MDVGRRVLLAAAVWLGVFACAATALAEVQYEITEIEPTYIWGPSKVSRRDQ